MEEGDSVVAPFNFTPAFGRAETRFARGFTARLKPGPSGLYGVAGLSLSLV
jgi:hypothetical protein